MLLRIQLERMEGAYFPSLREYFSVFGMTEARLRLARPDVIIMHPGPDEPRRRDCLRSRRRPVLGDSRSGRQRCGRSNGRPPSARNRFRT